MTSEIRAGFQSNTNLREIDPFQQGGGCMVKNDETGGDDILNSGRQNEIDTSFIPQEDCGTQTKSSNIKLLE